MQAKPAPCSISTHGKERSVWYAHSKLIWEAQETISQPITHTSRRNLLQKEQIQICKYLEFLLFWWLSQYSLTTSWYLKSGKTDAAFWGFFPRKEEGQRSVRLAGRVSRVHRQSSLIQSRALGEHSLMPEKVNMWVKWWDLHYWILTSWLWNF